MKSSVILSAYIRQLRYTLSFSFSFVPEKNSIADFKGEKKYKKNYSTPSQCQNEIFQLFVGTHLSRFT